MMDLDKKDQEFRNPKVFYPDPKAVDLDRVLVNLFMYLRCGGTRPVTRGRPRPTVEEVAHHASELAQMPGVTGFTENPAIAEAWLESDIFDLVNRGTAKEAVVSLRPLHLDAPKIRVAKHCRDYNVADAIYAMLDFGERQTLQDLVRYLDRGRDANTKRYDGKSELDLETLTVLKLVQELPEFHVGPDKVAPSPPLCSGQSRVLCDDVQRLLVYQDVIPRTVMIDYLKTIFGLHMALFTSRLARQLTGWVRDRQAHPTCLNCPVYGNHKEPFSQCPFPQSFFVDMGGDFRSRMAQLAQDSASAEYGRLIDLIKSIFTMNQLLRYANEDKGVGVADDPREVLSLLRNPPAQFDADFRAKLKQLRTRNEDPEGQKISAEEESILSSSLPPFELFIELITHSRQKHHLNYLTQMMDKLLQKNTEYGALVQGKSSSNPRRWQLGGRLLEVFVQLAVLRWHDGPPKRFYTQHILIEDFLPWMEARYGFVIGPPRQPGAPHRPVTIEEHRAYRENVRALKDRLREIGFYDDLSDAYNAQTIKPRYAIEATDAAAEKSR